MEQHEKKARAEWSGKLGFILATIGSAVGLGNIWKFPGRTFEGGGAAYIIIYIAIVLLMGVPLVMTELTLGRIGKSNCVDAFYKMDRKFAFTGWLAILVPFIITAYYTHVGGWVLKYFVAYLTDSASVFAEPVNYFYGMLGLDPVDGSTWIPWETLIYVAIFFAVCTFISVKGLSSGIEKFNKIGMPALFIILIVLLINTITLKGSAEGFSYLFKADWSKVTGATVLSALGQAFYSLSIGMGILVTYGSFLTKDSNVSKSSFIVCGSDTMVALLAGFMIIPACFATIGADNIGKGGGFAFMSLAGLFSEIPMGWLIGALFYLLLLFAAATSCISLFEVMVSFMTEHWHWDRKKSCIGLSLTLFLIGCLYTCSQAALPIKGIWYDLKNGLTFPTFADFMEFLPDRLLMPLCAFFICIFVGWRKKPEFVIEDVKQSSAFRWYRVYSFLVKFVDPICILAIMVYSFVTGTSIS